jgi:methionyl-tRNA formyltransferase
LSRLGGDLMVRALSALSRGVLNLTPQDEAGVTYAKKIDKAETRVDWRRPAQEVHDHIRALSPSPGSWCETTIGGKTERLKLLRSAVVSGAGTPGAVLDDELTIACGEGAIRSTELQRAGGKPATAAEFLRGARIAAGERLA